MDTSGYAPPAPPVLFSVPANVFYPFTAALPPAPNQNEQGVDDASAGVSRRLSGRARFGGYNIVVLMSLALSIAAAMAI
jgi:hypothetical protein